MSDICPVCKKKFHERRKKKLLNGGEKLSEKGRPRSFEYIEAVSLRAEGLSIRAISAALGVSNSAVQRALKSGVEK